MATVAREMDLTAVTRIGARRWTVASRTTAGVVYTVVDLGHGRGLQCSCDAALHGKRCWHIAACARVANREARWEGAQRQVIAEQAGRDDELLRKAMSIFMTAGRR